MCIKASTPYMALVCVALHFLTKFSRIHRKFEKKIVWGLSVDS
ncbi:hypothetical protein TREAZ_0651 [Leadbettera azotonutricia ZAS-9]|uniref:Uncharacterized protein n=1 Tax=Leadbettera azotonutricia (strain ATCC BAA-888 / DSM 13862 / ZAS-9) TaxID=545695 RepID=F5YAX8_LEAAZ|nr:hypothetical protein TREAZ_0651 [Leadbettera azotonutricia ZAS-9]